jgi:putative endopeptidase
MVRHAAKALAFISLAAVVAAQPPSRKPAVQSGIDLKAIDASVSPCVDFYQYACGTWMKNNPIPADESRWSRFNELQDRNREILRQILDANKADNPKRSAVDREIGDFYYACMDEQVIDSRGVEPIRPPLERIAGLPTKSAITAELVELQRQQIRPFFVIDAEQDAKDATQMIAGVDQGGLSLPDRDYYLKTDPKSVEIRQKFVEYVQKMFVLAGDPEGTAAAKAKTILRIETDLAKHSLDRVSRRDPNKIYHQYTVHELVSLSPGIDWDKFFAGMGVPGLKTLNVAYPPFMREIESVMVQNSLDDLKTYLSWNVITSSAPLLSKPFVDANWAFYSKTLAGAQQIRPRWKRCVEYTDELLGDALGQKYVERTFGAEGKARTLAMVRQIESAMERDIESIDWMSPATKKQALVKLNAVANKIGYPDKWKDYSSVKIARDDAMGNALRLQDWAVEYEMRKIGRPVDRSEWSMSPPTVNAYYNPQMNDINFPAGILQPPFYSNNADSAVNYGGIGAVVGHELTHGFDDEGRQFDAQGNLRDWWTDQDAKAFEVRAACIAKEYSGFTVVDDVKLNGELTLGENVADNGGVRLAYMALMHALDGKPKQRLAGFSPEQRFFLGFGQIWCQNVRPEFARMLATVDPHSPGRYRVNGVVQNDPDFARAFSCKPGQPMAPAKACRVW